MLGYSAKTVVSAPVDRVFSYLADFGKRNEWASAGVFGESPEGLVDVGFTFVEEGAIGAGADPSVKMEVIDVVANERIVWQQVGRLVRKRRFLEVQESGIGTRIKSGAQTVIDPRRVNVYFLLAGLLMLPLNLAALAMEWPYNRWQEGRALRRLKTLLEEG